MSREDTTVDGRSGEHDRLRAERDRLAEAVEELQRENAQLRELVGLASRGSVAAETPERPRLFRVSPLPQVDAGSSVADKLVVLRRLFLAREDAYATRWENERTGEAGYAPAVEGGWGRVRRGGDKTYLPLTDEVLEAHLLGEVAVGVFPLLDGDVCWWLACDFDGASSPLDALAYHEAATRHGIASAVERSRSGDGSHVWIFFSGLVAATTARRLGACLLREAMATRAELDLASYDRFIPSQDLLPKGGFGNLIALPLQGAARHAGNAVFVDPISREAYADQWAFLSDVQFVEPETAERQAEELDPPTAWRELTSATSRPAGARPAPDRVDAVLASGISVDKSGLPPWLLRDIKHLASIHNPEFYKKQRMRFSTHDTPRLIRCYDEDLTHLNLPRGLVEDLDDLLGDHDSSLSITDERPDHPPVGFRFQGELSELQTEAATALAREELGVLVAPPGVGKTVVALALVAERDTPTLVLVTTKQLLEQWREAASQLLGLDGDEVGQIGGVGSAPRAASTLRCGRR